MRAVVEAVSAATDVPAVELPPLYWAVDPDALNALFSAPDANGEITFRYAGCDVTVRADRTVDVSTGV
ncbi:HalOD1 output domain-containing protein [Halopelagius fulvigenes]|uniref:HalOD1 output domain-containing protein n=1 Tax=Halopelagius fulvigenes TaxID=1198324 RepID=A0ABD5U020_9EURY